MPNSRTRWPALLPPTLWILFPHCSYPFPHLTFCPPGIRLRANGGKMGKYTDSGHLLHILLCFSLSHFTLSKGRVGKDMQQASWFAPQVDSRNRCRLCNSCLSWKNPAPQSEAIFHPPSLAVSPLSAASTEAELLSCQQLLTRGQFLHRIIVAKKKKKIMTVGNPR